MTAIQSAPLAFDGNKIQIEASVGATTLPLDSLDTIDKAMRRADSDMYASKAAKGPRTAGKSAFAATQ